MTYRRALSAALVLLSLTGCSSAAGPPSAAGTSSASPAPSATAATPAESATARCGAPAAASTPVPLTVDGGRLSAYEVGTGPRGVLLVPELGRRGLCGWWSSYATRLADQGYHVLLFDHRCQGHSTCPTDPPANLLMDDISAGTAALRRDGATRTVLLGASQGGAEVIIAGTRPATGVVGIIALSPDELTDPLAAAPYPATATAAAPALTLPSLVAVASGDRYAPVTQTRAFVAAIAGPNKRLLVLPAGRGHGWDLVTTDSTGNRPASPDADIIAFLRSELP